MLRLALDLERELTQTRVDRDAELLRLASNVGLLRPASEVSILLGTRGPRFSSKRDLCVEARLTSDDLSLVIIGQSKLPCASPPPRRSTHHSGLSSPLGNQAFTSEFPLAAHPGHTRQQPYLPIIGSNPWQLTSHEHSPPTGLAHPISLARPIPWQHPNVSPFIMIVAAHHPLP